ncbi:hypothetical protein [Vogesella sp. AC12]|uniref:hypothetical protein n=1 Tax=Vogesella TaxID=57739 RepID=UPI00210A683C|nr:hypothetical protein [Vogesella sp. AC12]MCQ4143402.1 hypothetical protein [Vogesella sp. AC12]
MKQQDVSSYAGADVVGELPVKMELGEVGDPAKSFHGQRFAQVCLDIVEYLA